MNENIPEKLWISISPCVEFPNGDLMQAIGVHNSILENQTELDKLCEEMNTCKAEGAEIIFPMFGGFEEDLLYIPVGNDYYLANVIFMWG